MNGQQNQAGFEPLERRARAAFDRSVESLDGATLSRLNQSRQRALAAAAGTQDLRRPVLARRWYTWAPAGALAAGVLAAVVLLRAPVESPQGVAPLATTAAPAAAEAVVADAPLEVLAAGDEDFEIATDDEDLEFYAWIELAAADAASGQTG
jgi:hypothetical protein